MVRAEGCTLWDSEGREFLDVSGGGNWVAQVGHGRRELAEVMADQAATMAYFSCFYEFSNEPAIQLATRLAELAPPGIDRAFFVCGGSEGVDSAIKIARQYHHRRGEPERTWILARRFGYHGCTLGSGSVTGFPNMQIGVGPELPHVEKLTPPWPYRSELYSGQDPTAFLLAELERTIHRIGPGRIAAMIGEPVMGGAGVIIPPTDYWPRVSELLHSYGILLIADEVITAYGRTGAWFDSVGRGMTPDLIVTAKGLTSGYAPLGAVLMHERVGETLAGGDDLFFHGHTYSGHPVACAVGLRNLELIDREGLLDQSARIGDWFRAGLAPAAELPAVGEIRVAGATVGIELVVDRATREPMPLAPLANNVTDALREDHEVIARNYGSTLVLGPPLVLSREQADRASEAVVEVLSRLQPDGGLAPR